MLRDPAPLSATPLVGRGAMPDPLVLAGMVAARMCHDLAGSLGALTGTLELAVDHADDDALRLSLALAQDVAARLRLLRGAWGSMTDLPDWDGLLAGLPGAEKLQVDLSRLHLPENAARQLALSLLLVAASALPRGGRIIGSGKAAAFAMEIEGARAGWPAALAACLADEEALLEACDSPRNLAVGFACLLTRAQQRRLVVESPTRLLVLA